MWYQAQDLSRLQLWIPQSSCRNSLCRLSHLSWFPVVGRSCLTPVSPCPIDGMNCTLELFVLSPQVSRSSSVVHMHLEDV